jgi:carbohydrate-selective porin OprB
MSQKAMSQKATRPDDRYGKLDTEWGLELFDNLAITPWLQLSPSLQYIESGLPGVDESIVVTTRLQMVF